MATPAQQAFRKVYGGDPRSPVPMVEPIEHLHREIQNTGREALGRVGELVDLAAELRARVSVALRSAKVERWPLSREEEHALLAHRTAYESGHLNKAPRELLVEAVGELLGIIDNATRRAHEAIFLYGAK